MTTWMTSKINSEKEREKYTLLRHFIDGYRGTYVSLIPNLIWLIPWKIRCIFFSHM